MRISHKLPAFAAKPPLDTAIGWSAHYATGIVFAAALIGVWGLDWARHPTVLPALLVGVCTIVARSS